jgi:hypothetical protein
VAQCDYHRGVAEAQRALNRALELNDQAISGSNHILLCVTHLLNERMEALAAAADQAVKAAERSGDQVILHLGLGFRGWAREDSATMRPPATTWSSRRPSVLASAHSSLPIGSPSPAPTSPYPRDISTRP